MKTTALLQLFLETRPYVSGWVPGNWRGMSWYWVQRFCVLYFTATHQSKRSPA
ncbi:MAG: hypothetical protein JWO28_657, partial [Hyphomicrobiales bacterium]|nr:hypothetical protein [Hyphomicrobiales bacterium]